MVARRRILQIGRDAETGRFIPIEVARKRRATATVETINRQSGTERQLAMSYLGLRRGIGYIGLLLPFVLPIGKIIFDGHSLEGSMSAYFYTVTGRVFVGSLCAIGVFLISYRYKKWDIIASIIAGICAIFVAIFPTAPEVDPTATQKAIGIVHGVSAGLFFFILALMSIFLFTKTNPYQAVKPLKFTDYLAMLVVTRTKPEFPLNPRKKKRNIIYRVCGWIILFCIIGMGIVAIPAIKEHVDKCHPVFWLESIAVFAFGASWLVKGDTIMADRDKEKKFDERNLQRAAG
jgi:uncharacterized membrane protein